MISEEIQKKLNELEALIESVYKEDVERANNIIEAVNKTMAIAGVVGIAVTLLVRELGLNKAIAAKLREAASGDTSDNPDIPERLVALADCIEES